MIGNKLVYSIGGVLVLFLAACATIEDVIPVTGPDNAGASLAHTHWRLVSYGKPGSEIHIIKGTGVSLQFGDQGLIGGSTGCNTFSAQYKISGGRQLSITDMASTLIACSDTELMEQETQYLDALRSVESFEFTDESLTIHYAGGVLNFARIIFNTPRTVHF